MAIPDPNVPVGVLCCSRVTAQFAPLPTPTPPSLHPPFPLGESPVNLLTHKAQKPQSVLPREHKQEQELRSQILFFFFLCQILF